MLTMIIGYFTLKQFVNDRKITANFLCQPNYAIRQVQ